MPDQIEIDEARLTQIIVNLVGNAVKFTPAQGLIKVRANFIPDEVGRRDSRKSSLLIPSDDEAYAQREVDEYEEKNFYTKDFAKEDL